MKKMLVARPNFDDGTHYLHEWSGALIKEAQNKGILVTDVEGDAVIKKNIIGKLGSIKPEIVFLNGHGTKSSYCGHQMEEVLNCETSKALKGAITYVRACDCLETLGGEAVSNGCRAFIGYGKPFWIPMLNEYTARPLQDPVAKPVMEASNQVMKELINGNSALQAVDASRKLANRHAAEILFSKKFSGDINANPTLKALLMNKGSLNLRGDPAASIS